MFGFLDFYIYDSKKIDICKYIYIHTDTQIHRYTDTQIHKLYTCKNDFHNKFSFILFKKYTY